MGLLITLIFAFFCLALLSIPSVLTYWLFKYLKKKGAIQRKIGLIIFRITTIIMITYSGILLINGGGFGPEYDCVEIKQNIGGLLICNSVYNADHHSWTYDVSYKYKTLNNSTIDMGSGTYYGREWNKDEQLLQYKNWTILKTGDWIGNDKIIVADIKTNKWTEYKFTPASIEKDSMWRSLKIHSLLNYCCSETFIDKIYNGQIQLHYKFRIIENLVNEYGQKKVYYKIDDATGQPIMIKIE